MADNLEHLNKNTNNQSNDSLKEVSGFYFSSAVKIHDPNTDEVLVQIRGDN